MSTNNAVDKAMRLLRILAAASHPLRFTDLRELSGLPKATLHSILASLEAAEFVRRGPRGYEVGLGAFEVGTSVPVSSSMREAAAPFLDGLFETHDEACHLGLLRGGDVMYIDRRDSTHELRYTSRAGTTKPAYSTALGKAMLAAHSDDEVRELYPTRLPALTPATVKTRTELLRVLDAVRATGYATEAEESTPGVRCIGVGRRSGSLTYGVSVTVPVQRAELVDLPTYLPALETCISGLEPALKATQWFGQTAND